MYNLCENLSKAILTLLWWSSFIFIAILSIEISQINYLLTGTTFFISNSLHQSRLSITTQGSHFILGFIFGSVYAIILDKFVIMYVYSTIQNNFRCLYIMSLVLKSRVKMHVL